MPIPALRVLSRMILVALCSALGEARAEAQVTADTAREPGHRWHFVYADSEVQIGLDKTRIIRQNSGRYRVWFRWEYNEVQELPGTSAKLDEVLELKEVDCLNVKTRSLNLVARLANKTVTSSSTTGAWEEVVPESYGETVFLEACAYLRRTG